MLGEHMRKGIYNQVYWVPLSENTKQVMKLQRHIHKAMSTEMSNNTFNGNYNLGVG